MILCNTCVDVLELAVLEAYLLQVALPQPVEQMPLNSGDGVVVKVDKSKARKNGALLVPINIFVNP